MKYKYIIPVAIISYFLSRMSSKKEERKIIEGYNNGYLPQHRVKKFQQGSVSRFTKVVIYQSGEEDLKSVATAHVNFNMPGILFHRYIEKNGTLIKCNPYDNIIKDLKNGDENCINIALAGNFSHEMPTAQQLDTLNYVLAHDIRAEIIQPLTLMGYTGRHSHYLGGNLYYKIKKMNLPPNYSLSLFY